MKEIITKDTIEKKTWKERVKDNKLLVIACAIVVCFCLLLILLFVRHIPTKPNNAPTNTTAVYPTTNPSLISSSLSFAKNSGSVDVHLDSGADAVSGVQLVIAYNPKALTNVQINPGTFFEYYTVLRNIVDTDNGIMYLTLAVDTSSQAQKKGSGTIATISYQSVPGVSTALTFLPQTKITSEGINTSVLKKTASVTLP